MFAYDTCLAWRRIDLKVYSIQFTVKRTKNIVGTLECVLPELNIAESIPEKDCLYQKETASGPGFLMFHPA